MRYSMLGKHNRDKMCEFSPRTWMRALAQKFPDTRLAILRSTDPCLLPPWLLERGFSVIQDECVLRQEGIFARTALRRVPEECLPLLAATAHCRFREGFAAEGMLCDNPPIPLRVLDFLEDTEDLLSLALVSKAAHQAAHVLLRREFPGGIGPGLRNAYLQRAIFTRKQVELQRAMCHPIPSSTGSASALASGPGSHGGSHGPKRPKPLSHGAPASTLASASASASASALASASASASASALASASASASASALASPSASASAAASALAPGGGAQAHGRADSGDSRDFHCEHLEFTVITDEQRWSELDACMLILLRAKREPNPDPAAPVIPASSMASLLRDRRAVRDWQEDLKSGLATGLVLDKKSVARAVAQWDEFRMEPDRANVGMADAAETVMKVVRAAAIARQGVIVYPMGWIQF